MSARPSDRAPRFGVYLHVPLCRAKCPYCDFVSYPLDAIGPDGRERVVAALRLELDFAQTEHPSLRRRRLDSVYFGGGTPSLLDPEDIAGLLRGIFDAFPKREPVEVTLECNPMSAETERLAACREAGVNRVSLGIQSFDARILKSLGRPHTPDDGRGAIERIRALDFVSWGLDLIFGAPGSSLEQWRRDLDEAIRHEPPHVSVYGLTLHEGTPMWERHARGEITLPDEELQRRMFLEARSALTLGGWRHYEISNYARPGRESRHNSIYWTGGEYLGLGVAAHSFFDGTRRANPPALYEYLAAVEQGRHPAAAESPASLRSRRAERIMLALRQCDGVDPRQLSRELDCDFASEYAPEIERLARLRLIHFSPDNVRLTEEGILVSDSVFEEFF